MTPVHGEDLECAEPRHGPTQELEGGSDDLQSGERAGGMERARDAHDAVHGAEAAELGAGEETGGAPGWLVELMVMGEAPGAVEC